MIDGSVGLAEWLAALVVVESGKTHIAMRQFPVGFVAEAGRLVETAAVEAGTVVAVGKGAGEAAMSVAAVSFQRLLDYGGMVLQHWPFDDEGSLGAASRCMT